MASSPDLLVPLVSARSLLALAGVVAIVAGVWRADRTWDEKGSQAYERAKLALKRNAGTPVEIPPAELDRAFPFPWAFVLGWVLYGVANLFSATAADGEPFAVDISASSIASVVISLALGWIASVPMGEAVRYRDANKKQKLSLMFVASWLLLTALGGPEDEPILLALRAVGAIMIIASMKVLWKYRKMGDTWERDGVPNSNPVVYNAGYVQRRSSCVCMSSVFDCPFCLTHARSCL